MEATLNVTSKSLYTRIQMERVISAWNVGEPLPNKGKALWVAFPDRTTARITKTDMKGTDGRILFSLEWLA